MRTHLFSFLALLSLLVCAGCNQAYYNAWEKLGWEKRDLLVDEVEEARDEQKEAREQFQTTLDRFKAVTNFQGGELEAAYRKLNADYERSVSKAESVRKQISDVETVARDLFKEWETEIGQYSNTELRSESEQRLRDTRVKYDQMVAVMRRAEQRMQPVLTAFRDQVLFLKHNLNAAAIASLQTTAKGIESDVERLVAEMNASIAEADRFIKGMK